MEAVADRFVVLAMEVWDISSVRRSRGVAFYVLALMAMCLGGVPVGAEAAVVLCHGIPASIVGTSGSDAEGTDGPDVIVTNGAARVSAGAGDDLVCVTGGESLDYVDVSAGEGDDVIDTTASAAHGVSAGLGAGDDTYTGGEMGDFVRASDDEATFPSQGADTVSTGGGADHVVTGGSDADPDQETIDVGAGRDMVWLEGPADPARTIQGGTGSDLLQFDRASLRRELVIDNATGVATDQGTPAIPWNAFERFSLVPIGPWKAPAFHGGSASEQMWTGIPLTELDMGAGDDRVNLELQGPIVDNPSYAGGDGRDSFTLYAGPGDQAARVALDLPADYLLFRRDQRHHFEAHIDSFEKHKVSARRLDVRGTSNADHVQWAGCHGLIQGGRGADLIEAISPDDVGCWRDPDLVVRGDRGPDRLVGSDLYPDILIGGGGNDYADGRGGRDRCTAETTLRCEM
jgi:hypothetical protein